MRPRLILLTDIWGLEQAGYIALYVNRLGAHFDLQIYDSCQLGEVVVKGKKESEIHQQFVQDGINKAVASLLELEKEPIYILGCSVGGVIAWRAIQKGLMAIHFMAVSATRLRLETKKISSSFALHYGLLDPYVPSVDWFIKMKIMPFVHLHQGHNCYTFPAVADRICDDLLTAD